MISDERMFPSDATRAVLPRFNPLPRPVPPCSHRISAGPPRRKRSFSPQRPGAWSEPRKSGAGTPQPTAELLRPTRETFPPWDKVFATRRDVPPRRSLLNNAGAASGQCEALALFTVARRCRDPKPEPEAPSARVACRSLADPHGLIARVAPLAARGAADSVRIVRMGAALPVLRFGPVGAVGTAKPGHERMFARLPLRGCESRSLANRTSAVTVLRVRR